MEVTQVIGLCGAFLAAYAYIPQITHLIRERCTAGLSTHAFMLWLLASVLMTVHALYIHDLVFIVLGVVQVVATGLIIYYTLTFRGSVCQFHQHFSRHKQEPAKTESS